MALRVVSAVSVLHGGPCVGMELGGSAQPKRSRGGTRGGRGRIATSVPELGYAYPSAHSPLAVDDSSAAGGAHSGSEAALAFTLDLADTMRIVHVYYRTTSGRKIEGAAHIQWVTSS